MNDVSGKEMYNSIQGLKAFGATDEQIVKFIEFVETSDNKKLDELKELIQASRQSK